MLLASSNLKLVQDLVAEYQKGNAAGYVAGLSDDFKGSVLAGLVPGGEKIGSKADFVHVMETMGEYIDVKKFHPHGWHAVGDDVLFNVDWCFVWKKTGEEVATTALVRKVVKDGQLCEKYHMLDHELVMRLTGTESPPHSIAPVERVKALLAEYQKGNAPGYMEGCADDFKGSVLGGLVPGGEKIGSKAEFMGLMGTMDKYMDVKSFEPTNFRALPNRDMMFNVKWQFTWKPTGKDVEATAIVRKVLDAQGDICEKYHLVDADTILQESPRDVISSEA